MAIFNKTMKETHEEISLRHSEDNVSLPQICRQERIVEMVQNKGFISTDELVSVFQVTPQTIRRDLNELDRQGLVLRHHGGASLMASSTENTDYQQRKQQLNEEKQAIAKRLATRIPDGASLFINIGTTTEAVAHHLLGHSRLKVITNNLHVAAILLKKSDFTVIIAGGEVRNRDGGIVSQATRDFINQFYVDYAIIGISGINTDGALLDYDYQEVRVAQAMTANAKHTLLAADHSKFGRNAMVRMGNLKHIDALFTDRNPPDLLTQYIQESHTELVVC
ncbi:Glycerol-3-phosphate regulon repressor [invertebrate metagenome]|uniref:Glycerol-3-phosphate regulon repressor n=1 Tax=invertebrate metagenome TaxID=1711999 RepID=A0A2H9T8N9_9ZZZZ